MIPTDVFAVMVLGLVLGAVIVLIIGSFTDIVCCAIFMMAMWDAWRLLS